MSVGVLIIFAHISVCLGVWVNSREPASRPLFRHPHLRLGSVGVVLAGVGEAVSQSGLQSAGLLWLRVHL